MADDIMCQESPGKEWDTSEILETMLDRTCGEFESLDSILLGMALAGSDLLRALEGTAWAALKDDKSEDS